MFSISETSIYISDSQFIIQTWSFGLKKSRFMFKTLPLFQKGTLLFQNASSQFQSASFIFQKHSFNFRISDYKLRNAIFLYLNSLFIIQIIIKQSYRRMRSTCSHNNTLYEVILWRENYWPTLKSFSAITSAWNVVECWTARTQIWSLSWFNEFWTTSSKKDKRRPAHSRRSQRYHVRYFVSRPSRLLWIPSRRCGPHSRHTPGGSSVFRKYRD